MSSNVKERIQKSNRECRERVVKVIRGLSIGIPIIPSSHHLSDSLSYAPFAMVNVIDRPLCRVIDTRSRLDRGTLTSLAPAPQTQRSVVELVKR
jgi:hypothetical protein